MKKVIYLLVLLSAAEIFYACSKENNNPTDPCAGVTLSLTGTVTNTNSGQSSGAINAVASGGSGFTYRIGSGSFVSSGNFTGLAAGTYTITAKSSNGCTVSQTFTVGTNSNACTGVTIVVTGTVTPASTGQNNGAINATATGSTNLTYSINGTTFQATGSFTGLAAGTYTVTARNADGCTGTQTFTITTSNPCAGVTILVTGTITPATTGQSNGAISATATGSTNITYSINGTTFQASGNFTGLAAGTYTITAKNADGCTGTQTFTVPSNNPCTGVTVTVSTTVTNATSGNNGAIAATATGGSGFTYSINGGAFQASGTFTGLAAGTYTITAKNSDGCTGSATATVATVNPCAGVTINVSSSTTGVVPCGGPQGTILVNATGSTGFQYSINGGAFQSSNSFAGLATGSYSITVRDANNCTGTANATVSTAAAGPNFTAVKNIILNNCLSCHNNGNQQGGMNWQVDCNIVTFGQAIKNRAVDQAGTATQMPQPPNPPLSAADRQKIIDWLAAGGGYNH